MTITQLSEQIRIKKNCLCIGLDTDPNKIPDCLRKEKDPVFSFNKAIIEATSDLCVAYKPNLAFYESLGPSGWVSLEKTLEIIPQDIYTIADAKRGDIGNTSTMYANTFFKYFNFDAVTVAPYMGEDSVLPFLVFEDKAVILLALTSNPGSRNFQQLNIEGKPLYEHVIRQSCQWAGPDKLMFVIGATHPEKLKEIREMAPDYFFLVPGVGAQGGSLKDVMENGRNAHTGLIVNSSREIIYAGSEADFAEKARAKAEEICKAMATYIP